MLFDPARASFSLVTIPEAMAFEETARYFTSLREEGVPVTDLIINRVERAHGGCPFCRARARDAVALARRFAREFKTLTSSASRSSLPKCAGPEALREFARVAWQPAR